MLHGPLHAARQHITNAVTTVMSGGNGIVPKLSNKQVKSFAGTVTDEAVMIAVANWTSARLSCGGTGTPPATGIQSLKFANTLPSGRPPSLQPVPDLGRRHERR